MLQYVIAITFWFLPLKLQPCKSAYILYTISLAVVSKITHCNFYLEFETFFMYIIL